MVISGSRGDNLLVIKEGKFLGSRPSDTEDINLGKTIDSTKGLFSAFIPVDRIKDGRVLRSIAGIFRKRIDQIENYAQGIMQLLLKRGLLVRYKSGVIPYKHGFRIVIDCKLVAVDREIVDRLYVIYRGHKFGERKRKNHQVKKE